MFFNFLSLYLFIFLMFFLKSLLSIVAIRHSRNAFVRVCIYVCIYDCSHEIQRRLLLGRKVMTNLDIEKQRHYFANKGPSSQGYGFSSGHVWMRVGL